MKKFITLLVTLFSIVGPQTSWAIDENISDEELGQIVRQAVESRSQQREANDAQNAYEETSASKLDLDGEGAGGSRRPPSRAPSGVYLPGEGAGGSR